MIRMTSLSLMLSLEVRVTDHATVNLIGPARRKSRRASATPMPVLEMTRSTCAYPTACTWSPTCPYESSNLNGDIPTPSIAKYMERIVKCVGLLLRRSQSEGKKQLEISPDNVITAMKRCDNLFFTSTYPVWKEESPSPPDSRS